MIDSIVLRTALPAGTVLAVAAALSSRWGLPAALGVLAGGAWNLASLWCLTQLLNAWLIPSPSKRRAIGWLLVKFPCLYTLAFLAIRTPWVSLIGFGIGFSLVLLVALWAMGQHARHAVLHPHGR